nr:hypothetical protein GCM10025732_09760 [Glycomyces mayteni]
MGQKITFNLPDLGEGLTEGEVAAWLVEPGGEVKLNQPFVEVETAKALVEVPSPYDGVLAEHCAEAGATVDVGKPLATFEVEGSTRRPWPRRTSAPRTSWATAPARPGPSAAGARAPRPPRRPRRRRGRSRR